MLFDRFTLEKIRRVSLLDVAKELKIKCKGTGHWYRAKCFIHEDHSPSLGLHSKTGRWCCFACGEKGDVIGLVRAHLRSDASGGAFISRGWMFNSSAVDV